MNQRVATFKLILNGHRFPNCHRVIINLLLDLTSKSVHHCLLQSSGWGWRGGWLRGFRGAGRDYWLSILWANTNTFLCGAVQSIQNTSLQKIISFLILKHLFLNILFLLIHWFTESMWLFKHCKCCPMPVFFVHWLWRQMTSKRQNGRLSILWHGWQMNV